MSISSAVATGGPNNAVVLTGAVRAVYSQEILHNAQPVMRFSQFAERKEELQRQAGDTINFLRYDDVEGDPTLVEATDMTPDNLTSSLLSIQVGERGKALQATERLLVTSFDDVMGSMARKLGEHYARSLDGEIRNCLRGTPNLIRVGGAATRAAMTGNEFFNLDTVRDAAETLATNKCPKFDDDAYICFVHPHQASRIRRDPDWIEVVKYGDPTRVYRGEIGRVEDVRFISTTNTTVVKSGAFATPGQVQADRKPAIPALADEVDFQATADIYQAYMFGPYAVGHATALRTEMRDGGVLDHGRRHSLAWYGIYGCGRIEDGHSLIIESA